jgi:glutamine amidotransferase
MGWNQLSIPRPSPLFEGVAEGTYCYFVHSFYVVPEEEEVIATKTDYHHEFCSSIRRGNLFATQFHPEKSQSEGLKILRNFGSLS